MEYSIIGYEVSKNATDEWVSEMMTGFGTYNTLARAMYITAGIDPDTPDWYGGDWGEEPYFPEYEWNYGDNSWDFQRDPAFVTYDASGARTPSGYDFVPGAPFRPGVPPTLEAMQILISHSQLAQSMLIESGDFDAAYTAASTEANLRRAGVDAVTAAYLGDIAASIGQERNFAMVHPVQPMDLAAMEHEYQHVLESFDQSDPRMPDSIIGYSQQEQFDAYSSYALKNGGQTASTDGGGGNNYLKVETVGTWWLLKEAVNESTAIFRNFDQSDKRLLVAKPGGNDGNWPTIPGYTQGSIKTYGTTSQSDSYYYPTPITDDVSFKSLAVNLGRGIGDALRAVTVGTVLNAADLATIVGSLAWNEAGLRDLVNWSTNSKFEKFYGEMYSDTANAYLNGTSQGELVISNVPILNLGVVGYHALGAVAKSDWNNLARMSGAMAGGIAMGAGLKRFGDYNITFEPLPPLSAGELLLGMKNQRGAIGRIRFEKVIKNSAGEDVLRQFVRDQDELLAKAEEAAGGSFENCTRLDKLSGEWYLTPDGKRKIEWEPEGHKSTDEGPHVTIRELNPSGGWSVTAKFFIDGWETFKKNWADYEE